MNLVLECYQRTNKQRTGNKDGAAIYKYLNFNQIEEYVENAKGVTA